jgi:hypothetical protein
MEFNEINMSRYLDTETEDGYVEFNADRRLGQNQYASRYIEGKRGYECLGEGLRFKNLDGNYHEILIHKDDLLEFHRRVENHKNKLCQEWQ